MHAHKIDTVLIRDNVRLEVLYESNPYYMNESISLVIRLKHLGSVQTKQRITERIAELTGKTENGNVNDEQTKPGLIGSLWKSLNQEQQFKEEEESKLVQELEKQLQFNNPVELVSFYYQLTGTLHYDSHIVDGNKLQQTSKVVGVGGTHSHPDLLATKMQQLGTDSVAKYVNTDAINSLEDGLKEAGEEGHEKKEIPLLILPQTLVFTELVLNPGDLKMFYCKSARLPRSLPPSYTGGKVFKVGYVFQVGGIANVGPDMHSMFFNFPLNICSYVDQEGIQYVPKLDKPPFILPPGTVRDIDEGRRRRSTPSAGTLLNRKSSIQSLGEFHLNHEKAKKLQEQFKNFASGVDETGDIDKAVEELMLFQFGEAERSDIEEEDDLVDMLGNADRITFNFSSTKSETRAATSSDHATKEEEQTIQAFINLKKDFVVNRNGEKICHINLSKDYYTICEDIDLVIEFPQNSNFKVTAVKACLQTVETLNPQYLHDSNVTQYNILPIYEANHVCFDELNKLPIKLLCNRTPNYMHTAQFQNNIFQYKWMISLKFVVVNRKESNPLESFYEDKNGKLYHARKQLVGQEFNFQIPVTVLPSNKQFGGW